ncbi:phosphoribosylglycinamide formyltransferase [SAR92 clade bacterium H921]|jgi:phosphoribosylglycinamide formyltransferase-1|nr:phosphoribosylglycinamide formyltransferase [SAR92 clade bacterium H921]
MSQSLTGKEKARLVVLISGGGSNLQSFIDACENKFLNAEIAAVISNKANVKGLERAANANIPNIVIDHRGFDSREEFDEELATLIESFNPHLVILAGFMRILTADFVARFLGKLINIHPSLLPAYPGLHTHQRAIDAGDNEAGATVHFVTPELDGGPSVLQARVPIKSNDSAEILASRVLTYEHQIYPQVAQWFCQGRLIMKEGIAILDGEFLGENGIIFGTTSEQK